ncbi:MAG: hypothetical protein NTNFB02_20700 [Nitrospira sp.]
MTVGGTVRWSGIVARIAGGLCALLWLAGSFSVVYAGLAEGGAKVHCHHGQAHPQNAPGHCSSHCHAIDSQAVHVQNRCSPVAPFGCPPERFRGAINGRHLYHGVVSRGPPASLGHRNAPMVDTLRLKRET